jgi:hypothetical protein
MPVTAMTSITDLAWRHAQPLAVALTGRTATTADLTEDGFAALVDRALTAFGGVPEIAAPLAEAFRALDAYAILGARNPAARQRLLGEAHQALVDALDFLAAS